MLETVYQVDLPQHDQEHYEMLLAKLDNVLLSTTLPVTIVIYTVNTAYTISASKSRQYSYHDGKEDKKTVNFLNAKVDIRDLHKCTKGELRMILILATGQLTESVHSMKWLFWATLPLKPVAIYLG